MSRLLLHFILPLLLLKLSFISSLSQSHEMKWLIKNFEYSNCASQEIAVSNTRKYSFGNISLKIRVFFPIPPMLINPVKSGIVSFNESIIIPRGQKIRFSHFSRATFI
jgi:hypothetical protein